MIHFPNKEKLVAKVNFIHSPFEIKQSLKNIGHIQTRMYLFSVKLSHFVFRTVYAVINSLIVSFNLVMHMKLNHFFKIANVSLF